MANNEGLRKSSPLSSEEEQRYARHLQMPEIGPEGQAKLKAASVLLVGVGGLGSAASLYLAAAGVGRIGLVDHDVVDLANLQRQIIHTTAQIGRPKILSARERLLEINPHLRVDVHDMALSADNAQAIFSEYQIIVDATDNYPARYLINQECVRSAIPFVHASAYRFEGQVSVFWASRGPCYQCLYPAPPPDGLVPTSAEVGIFSVLPGTLGTLQAAETLKLLLGIGEPLIGRLLLYDVLSASFEAMHFAKDPNCRICSTKSKPRS
jgi:molybdopterin/thiamine biosynthesis adenylyltransferase